MSAKIKRSGQEVAKQAKVFAKTDVRYWERVVFKPWFTRAGEKIETKQFSVRINHQGKRLAIPLGLANKTEAARRAREIYLSLITSGWQATLAKFHPKHIQPQVAEMGECPVITVGEWSPGGRRGRGRAAVAFGFLKDVTLLPMK